MNKDVGLFKLLADAVANGRLILNEKDRRVRFEFFSEFCSASGVLITRWDWVVREMAEEACRAGRPFLLYQTELAKRVPTSRQSIQRLRPLMYEVRLVEPRDEQWVDETVSSLHEEMPWMSAATNEGWHALRRISSTKDTVSLPKDRSVYI